MDRLSRKETVMQPQLDTPADRDIAYQTMETLLRRVGNADLHNERAYLRAHAEDATEHDRLMSELARDNLEIMVHRVIEYGRELVLRSRENQSPDTE